MRTVLFIIITLLCISQASGQQRNSYALYDSIFGESNSGIFNGMLHLDHFRKADKTHRYYNTNDYLTGDVTFDGQFYTGVPMKYDLLDDILVVKLPGSGNTAGLNLVPQKTQEFLIDQKHFVNLGLRTGKPEFINGFYELAASAQGLDFYIKHTKERIEVLTNKTVLNRFADSEYWLFQYADRWKIIKTERDAVDMFPQLQNQISAFYSANEAMRRSNPRLFFTSLTFMIGKSFNQKGQ